MSELIDNSLKKKELLKHLMLQVHEGETPEAVRNQLARLMGEVPYDTVVEVEQELLGQGLSTEQILKFCDIHASVLKGQFGGKSVSYPPAGHPATTFHEENAALQWELRSLDRLFDDLVHADKEADVAEIVDQIRIRFNTLADVEKHYQRKENLLFPFLEKHGITGPSKVMWAKDDEARELLYGGIETLQALETASLDEVRALADLVLRPAKEALDDMVFREEEILLPMSLDTLSESEWWAILQQTPEYGYCLYDPPEGWRPQTGAFSSEEEPIKADRIQLPSGSFTAEELNAILGSIPFDLTFVDKEDRVRYFTQGRERIFARSRAILGHKVQLCHPPSSVHVVERIIEDFRAGRESQAPFWINLKGKFIHIEYLALRDREGGYLGTLEVSQDLTNKRSLSGEQRLLSYAMEDPDGR